MITEFRKFMSYFFVGGMAAIVEWITFAAVNTFTNYNISVVTSFILATSFNYYFGKRFTFKNCKQSNKDIIGVFIVSGIGLILNILLMNLFIKVLNFNYELLAKILSTGIVFVWNYISRRIFIYKQI